MPFHTTITIANPLNPAETYESLLWPDHCVQGTPGNALLPELDARALDGVVLKGTDPRVEMYSAFRAPLRDPPLPEAVSELGRLLAEAGVTDVVVGGLAGDYCVKCTAVDSAEGGWRTYVVEDAQRCVYGEEGWRKAREEMEGKGVRIVSSEWVVQVSRGYDDPAKVADVEVHRIWLRMQTRDEVDRTLYRHVQHWHHTLAVMHTSQSLHPNSDMYLSGLPPGAVIVCLAMSY